MQNIIIEEPYQFVPPVYSDWWPWIIRAYLRRYLRKSWGVPTVECRNVEGFREPLEAGHSIILTPNHCRLSDPLVLGILAQEAGCFLFAMGSWHLFKEDWFTTFMIRRMGAFSVYREGSDRAAVNEAIHILSENLRPLIMFPEGALSRHNDVLMELMDGPGFIARQAARKRQKQSPAGQVVVLPVAIRYAFDGNLHEALEPVLDKFEARFTWPPQRNLNLVDRIRKIGEALLSLKEVEYLGAARAGDPYERAEILINQVLSNLEAEWGIKDPPESTVARVKRLRLIILPDLIAKKVTPEERARRWRDLSACYYVQQISHYPRDYVSGEGNLPERLLETVERYEEDFTDQSHRHEPLHCTIQVGQAIPISPTRDRSAAEDPVTAEIRRQLQSMLDALQAERTSAQVCSNEAGSDAGGEPENTLSRKTG